VVKVHIWWPDVKGNIGHGSVLVNDTYISNWPGELSSALLKVQMWGKGAANTYQDDVNAEGGPPNSVTTIDGLDEAAMQKWWTEFQRSPRYSIWFLNCMQTVGTALCIGSPNPIYARHTGFAITAHAQLWLFAKNLSVLHGW